MTELRTMTNGLTSFTETVGGCWLNRYRYFGNATGYSNGAALVCQGHIYYLVISGSLRFVFSFVFILIFYLIIIIDKPDGWPYNVYINGVAGKRSSLYGD
jgi:hypothetical protein